MAVKLTTEVKRCRVLARWGRKSSQEILIDMERSRSSQEFRGQGEVIELVWWEDLSES